MRRRRILQLRGHKVLSRCQEDGGCGASAAVSYEEEAVGLPTEAEGVAGSAGVCQSTFEGLGR